MEKHIENLKFSVVKCIFFFFFFEEEEILYSSVLEKMYEMSRIKILRITTHI